MTDSRKWITFLTIIMTGICLWFFVFLFQEGYLLDPSKLQTLLVHSGALAPVLFVGLQIFQTVIPVIPGGVTSAIGVICFGNIGGFLLNYVGLCIGSVIVFWLVKVYGKPFIQKVTDQKTMDKYIGWLDRGKKFDRFFSFAILMPGFPDDLLCMIAGLTRMTTARFIAIILLCKPFGLILYSQGLTILFQEIARLF
ncbi:VTT domain-containing protein [uncultured Faecalicoccus sp.]|uniref:TVP38/TMEM64 family protein n=1 Tax=uncultured Faecalicoccus sp. TaxID=1971760 RepID=UPI0025F3BAFB|nr:VTT domain-containing protein [uncultured Faecalicoccus sp.]